MIILLFFTCFLGQLWVLKKRKKSNFGHLEYYRFEKLFQRFLTIFFTWVNFSIFILFLNGNHSLFLFNINCKRKIKVFNNFFTWKIFK